MKKIRWLMGCGTATLVGVCVIPVFGRPDPGGEKATATRVGWEVLVRDIEKELESREVLMFEEPLGDIGLEAVSLGEELLLSEEDVLTVTWREKRLEVLLNGVDLDAEVEMTPTVIRWRVWDDSLGNPLLSGIVTGAAEEEYYALMVATPDMDVNFLSTGMDLNDPDRALYLMVSGVCNCFGLGTATSKCSDKNCTEGVSCGTNRACRWSAGA